MKFDATTLIWLLAVVGTGIPAQIFHDRMTRESELTKTEWIWNLPAIWRAHQAHYPSSSVRLKYAVWMLIFMGFLVSGLFLFGRSS